MDDNPIPPFTAADLSESERAAYDCGEAVLRTIPGNPVYGRWIQKLDLGSYDERRKAESS